ncbi:hypothetical protein GCM10027511_03680 [Hymenobacter humi]
MSAKTGSAIQGLRFKTDSAMRSDHFAVVGMVAGKESWPAGAACAATLSGAASSTAAPNTSNPLPHSSTLIKPNNLFIYNGLSPTD